MTQRTTGQTRGPYVALGLWALALVYAAVSSQPWTLHTKLTIGGAALEVTGLILLAFDLLGPSVAEGWRRARGRGRRASLRVRRWLRLPLPTQIIRPLGIAGESSLALGVSIRSNATLTLESLKRSLDETTQQLEQMRQQHAADIAAVRDEIDKTEKELSESVTAAIAESRGEFFALRLIGFGVALLGSTVLAAANLL
jgi:hypothetical protein